MVGLEINRPLENAWNVVKYLDGMAVINAQKDKKQTICSTSKWRHTMDFNEHLFDEDALAERWNQAQQFFKDLPTPRDAWSVGFGEGVAVGQQEAYIDKQAIYNQAYLEGYLAGQDG